MLKKDHQSIGPFRISSKDPPPLTRRGIVIFIVGADQSVAKSHCSIAMGAGVLELAGLEEVLHGRMAVRTLHGLHIMVDERLTLCRGAARDFHYDHFARIAHHGSILGRCRE